LSVSLCPENGGSWAYPCSSDVSRRSVFVGVDDRSALFNRFGEWIDVPRRGYSNVGLGHIPGYGERPLRWIGRILLYPDGSVEGSFSPRRHKVIPVRVCPAIRLVDEILRSPEYALHRWRYSEYQRHLANLARAEQRARVRVKEYVRFYNCTRLLTFTNGCVSGGWVSRKDALDDISAFMKHERKRWFGDVPIVAVAEKGGRSGRWHVHCAIPSDVGWLDYRGIIWRWSDFLNRRGYISPTGTHRFHAGDEQGRYRKGFRDASHAARYMCKYMSKGFEDESTVKGEHRYRSFGCLGVRAVRVVGSSIDALRSLLALPYDYMRAVFCPISGGFRTWKFDCRYGVLDGFPKWVLDLPDDAVVSVEAGTGDYRVSFDF